MFKRLFVSLVFLLSLHANAVTQKSPKVQAPPTPTVSPVKTESAPDKKGGATTLWDSWYTVSIGGKLAYGYYHDKVEEKDGKIAFQNQYWKKEEGFINEEQLISFSENKPDLPPVLFNFKSTYRGTVLDLDGTFSGNIMKVKARKDKADLPKVERSIGKGAFLSSQFSIWIGKNVQRFKLGRRETFTAILEDNLDRQFQPVGGSLILEPADDLARRLKSNKFSIEYNGQKSTWYVKHSGETERIEISGAPGATIIVEKTAEAKARRFLMEK